MINKTRAVVLDLRCRADNATKLDSLGRYHIRRGAAVEKNQVTRWANTTFAIPTSIKSKTDQRFLIFRNMLVKLGVQKSRCETRPRTIPA